MAVSLPQTQCGCLRHTWGAGCHRKLDWESLLSPWRWNSLTHNAVSFSPLPSQDLGDVTHSSWHSFPCLSCCIFSLLSSRSFTILGRYEGDSVPLRFDEHVSGGSHIKCFQPHFTETSTKQEVVAQAWLEKRPLC